MSNFIIGNIIEIVDIRSLDNSICIFHSSVLQMWFVGWACRPIGWDKCYQTTWYRFIEIVPTSSFFGKKSYWWRHPITFYDRRGKTWNTEASWSWGTVIFPERGRSLWWSLSLKNWIILALSQALALNSNPLRILVHRIWNSGEKSVMEWVRVSHQSRRRSGSVHKMRSMKNLFLKRRSANVCVIPRNKQLELDKISNFNNCMQIVPQTSLASSHCHSSQ